MKVLVFLIGFAAILLAMVSCTDTKIADFNSKEDGPFVPSEEAQTMAIWLSGELEAPMDMARIMDRDLAHMRANFSEQVPELLSIQFEFPYAMHHISLRCKPEITQAILDGIYHEWAELNKYLGVSNIHHTPSYPNSFSLKYERIANPILVAEQYEQLDGVEKTYNAFRLWDVSNIYPWHVDGELCYLLRTVVMDGIHDHSWYFKKTDGVIELVGDYDPEVDPIPDWWDEIEPAYCMYIYNNDGNCWPRDYPN